MKILLVSRFFPYIGGRESIVLILAEELSKRHEVAVLTPDIGRVSSKYQIFRYLDNSIEKVLTEFCPDIISSHTFYLTPKIIKENKKRVPIVLTLHGDLLNFGTKGDKQVFLEMVHSLKKIVAVCKHGYEQLLVKAKIEPVKLSLIQYGIDTDVFRPRNIQKAELRQGLRLPANKFLFVTPARMTYYKGIEFLLETISRLSNLRNEMHFLIATPPSRFREDEIEYTRKILGIAKDKGLDEMFSVGFYDFVSMPFLYNASDALILPSMTEQLPVSILEAEASGLPVIASNVGGVSEIVIPKRTGFLVDYGETKELAAAIMHIYTNKEEYCKMSDGNPAFVKSFYAKERMLDEYKNLFTELVNI